MEPKHQKCGLQGKKMTNAFTQSLDGAICFNSSDLSFLATAAGQTLPYSTNPARHPSTERDRHELRIILLLKALSMKWRVSAVLLPSERDDGKAQNDLFSVQNGWSVQEAFLSPRSQRSPSGRLISVAEGGVSQFLLGRRSKRSEGTQDAGKLPSGAGVCQQQAEPVHTVCKCGPAWAGPGLRKTNQAYKGKYTDWRRGVCVCERETVHSCRLQMHPFLQTWRVSKTFRNF